VIERPEDIILSGVKAFESGIVKWLLPMGGSGTRPSGHAIIHHIWSPGVQETKAGIWHGFGATIAALAGPEECGRPRNIGAILRIQTYMNIMELLGAKDIAQLDGEYVSCGHVLFPSVTDAVTKEKTYSYPANYTTKTPMYFQRMDADCPSWISDY